MNPSFNKYAMRDKNPMRLKWAYALHNGALSLFSLVILMGQGYETFLHWQYWLPVQQCCPCRNVLLLYDGNTGDISVVEVVEDGNSYSLQFRKVKLKDNYVRLTPARGVRQRSFRYPCKNCSHGCLTFEQFYSRTYKKNGFKVKQG
eukprot:748880-Hanusia_phi.AAC.2